MSKHAIRLHRVTPSRRDLREALNARELFSERPSYRRYVTAPAGDK